MNKSEFQKKVNIVIAQNKATVGAVCVILICFIYKFYVWTNTETTDNAYVKSDITLISSQINGTIKEIVVGDNVAVKVGDVIARIDDTIYKASLEQANLKLQSMEYANKITDQKRVIEQTNFDKLNDVLRYAELKYNLAEKDYKRNISLNKDKFASQKTLDDSRLVMEDAKNAVSQATFEVASSKENLELLNLEYKNDLIAISDAKQAQIIAQKNLHDTAIKSSVDGIVAGSGIRVGNFVTAGTPLVYVVPKQLYITANFKETQIKKFYAGQAVVIKFDAVDGLYNGKIRNISPASGATFTLIPVDNATGNFTKIVQRVPVNIDFDYAALQGLSVGMSLTVWVDTRY